MQTGQTDLCPPTLGQLTDALLCLKLPRTEPELEQHRPGPRTLCRLLPTQRHTSSLASAPSFTRQNTRWTALCMDTHPSAQGPAPSHTRAASPTPGPELTFVQLHRGAGGGRALWRTTTSLLCGLVHTLCRGTEGEKGELRRCLEPASPQEQVAFCHLGEDGPPRAHPRDKEGLTATAVCVLHLPPRQRVKEVQHHWGVDLDFRKDFTNFGLNINFYSYSQQSPSSCQ